jgi:hypothetical protein
LARADPPVGGQQDVELLAALAADNFELILEGSRFPPGTNEPRPTPQTTLDTGQGRGDNVRTLEQGPPPQRPTTRQQPGPASQHPARTKQNQARPLDQQQRPAGQIKANRGHQDGDSQAQPGYSSQKQPMGHQPPASTPQAQLPTARQGASTNGRKTGQTKKKALKRYWIKVFRQGE